MNARRMSAVLVCLVGCGGVAPSNLSVDGGDGGGDASGGGETVAITLSASCASVTPCGGDVVGTWTPSGGCIVDPLATAKSLCPLLTVNSEVATVTGSVTFSTGAAMRNYVAHYGMDITIPAICLDAETCAEIESGYQLYVPGTTCTDVADGACRCTGSIDTTAAQESAYTETNDEIVTPSGDHYVYCVSGSTMQYQHISGPAVEIGSYTLKR
jgi:hypothetical protein